MLPERTVLSVKELNQIVKDLLADAIGQIWLLGEISNFSQPASGHWYFTLKDDAAQVRCAMFRNTNVKTGFVPKNGQQVFVSANVTLYETRGEYQLVVNGLQPAGAGILQQQYEQLKKKLNDEGLFDPKHKKALPEQIQTVGIITSSTGAALHDICQILNRRDPGLAIIIYPTQVQGKYAASQIANMIKMANLRAECDVLIVGRGGGSFEDLWSFNEEVVARAIFDSSLPIVSAVGHEIDFTIADFVADIRAATPSAAAELVSKDKIEQLKRLQVKEQQLSMAFDYYLMQSREKLNQLKYKLDLQHPQAKLAKQINSLLESRHSLVEAIQQYMYRYTNHMNMLDKKLGNLSLSNKLSSFFLRITQAEQKISALAQQRFTVAKHQLAMNASKLNSVSPLSTLARGYSITYDNKKAVIKNTQQVAIGDVITTQLTGGKLVSKITVVLD